MTLEQLYASVPQAAAAHQTIVTCQTAADPALSDPANQAAALMDQLNQGQISKAEFQDLVKDIQSQITAEAAASNLQWRLALKQSLDVMVFVAQQLAL